MLFNSVVFLFVFLPLTYLSYGAMHRWSGRMAARGVLLLASALFYAWWSLSYLCLLLFLLGVNYALGERLRRLVAPAPRDVVVSAGLSARTWLVLGVGLNLAVLGLFKYSPFVLDNLSRLGMGPWPALAWVLPLGISFYTFQKIAYLVDCYQGRVRRVHLADFSLFVLFFPQLIAGPIVHHRYFFRHLRRRLDVHARKSLFWCGLTLLLIGLFKKVVLADNLALIAAPGFAAPAAGWGLYLAVLAYTLQIYFDFSGYSDMAIGLAGLFGLRLPLNFASPYRARSMVEFWRRWHITLSGFLRDYLYIPLGGNRDGRWRRQRNLLLTMLIGGFWHGASWNFLLWGGLHGLYLALNHGWRACGRPYQLWLRLPGHAVVGWGLTLLLVAWAWVPFRAPDLATTLQIWRGLLQGVSGWPAWPVWQWALVPDFLEVRESAHGLWLALGLAIALFLPNSQSWVGYSMHGPAPALPTAWRLAAASVLGLLAVKAIVSDVPSVFLYFNF